MSILKNFKDSQVTKVLNVLLIFSVVIQITIKAQSFELDTIIAPILILASFIVLTIMFMFDTNKNESTYTLAVTNMMWGILFAHTVANLKDMSNSIFIYQISHDINFIIVVLFDLLTVIATGVAIYGHIYTNDIVSENNQKNYLITIYSLFTMVALQIIMMLSNIMHNAVNKISGFAVLFEVLGMLNIVLMSLIMVTIIAITKDRLTDSLTLKAPIKVATTKTTAKAPAKVPAKKATTTKSATTKAPAKKSTTTTKTTAKKVATTTKTTTKKAPAKKATTKKA